MFANVRREQASCCKMSSRQRCGTQSGRMFFRATFLFLSSVILPFWRETGGHQTQSSVTILYKLHSHSHTAFSVSLFPNTEQITCALSHLLWVYMEMKCRATHSVAVGGCHSSELILITSYLSPPPLNPCLVQRVKSRKWTWMSACWLCLACVTSSATVFQLNLHQLRQANNWSVCDEDTYFRP